MENDVLTCDECGTPIYEQAIVVGDNSASGIYCSDHCLWQGLFITTANPEEILNDKVIF